MASPLPRRDSSRSTLLSLSPPAGEARLFHEALVDKSERLRIRKFARHRPHLDLSGAAVLNEKDVGR